MRGAHKGPTAPPLKVGHGMAPGMKRPGTAEARTNARRVGGPPSRSSMWGSSDWKGTYVTKRSMGHGAPGQQASFHLGSSFSPTNENMWATNVHGSSRESSPTRHHNTGTCTFCTRALGSAPYESFVRTRSRSQPTRRGLQLQTQEFPLFTYPFFGPKKHITK